MFDCPQAELKKQQKKIAEANIKKAVVEAVTAADSATSVGKKFCVCRVDVGQDAAAVREAVLKARDQKVTFYPFLFLMLHLQDVLLHPHADWAETASNIYFVAFHPPVMLKY